MSYHPRQPPQQAPEPEPEPEPDYFSELGLEPTIKKPTKVSNEVVLQELSTLSCESSFM